MTSLHTPNTAVPSVSPGIRTNEKLRPYGIMAYFVTGAASKPEVKRPQRQIYGKSKAHEHEYPIQFMTALANTMQRIAEACNPMRS
jgi:hypothetical protein